MTPVAGAYAGLILGGADFEKKLEWRGLPPWKLLTFDPFVNGIVVILVNFRDFVIFSFFFLDFCQIGFRTPLPAYAPASCMCFNPKSLLREATDFHVILKLHNRLTITSLPGQIQQRSALGCCHVAQWVYSCDYRKCVVRIPSQFWSFSPFFICRFAWVSLFYIMCFNPNEWMWPGVHDRFRQTFVKVKGTWPDNFGK